MEEVRDWLHAFEGFRFLTTDFLHAFLVHGFLE